MGVTSAADLDQLAERIRAEIPLSRHLDFRLLERQGASLTLAAPLMPNQNDKGTMFAGSIATLSTLAGWALTGQLAADAGCAVDVLAVKGDIDYRLPIRQDALFVARADVDLLALFGERLARRGKARMRVLVEARVDDAVCARFSGDYLAQVMADTALDFARVGG